jgi:15-cis-phytoene desaturase
MSPELNAQLGTDGLGAWRQDYVDAQDEYSVAQWMEKNRMPQRISDELFVAMAKALDFIDPDKLSMTVVLTAMNRFLNETDGSQTAFLDGNQPERLCRPMQVCAPTRQTLVLG